MAGAFAGGAVAGAVGALAGPIGGTAARALGLSSTSFLAGVTAGALSGAGGALGQLTANVADPCHKGNVLNAAFWSALGGGLVKGLIPTRNLNSLSQAWNFAPSTIGGLFGTPNAWLNLGSFATSGGLGAASNWPQIGPFGGPDDR